MVNLSRSHPLYEWQEQFVEQYRSEFVTDEEFVQVDDTSSGISGSYRKMWLREGMALVVSDFQYEETIRIESVGSRPWVELSFTLRGGRTNEILGYQEAVPEKDGDAYLLLCKDIESVTELLGGTRSYKVELMLNPLLWASYVKHFWNFTSEEELLAQMVAKPFNVAEHRTSPAIANILRQIVNCSYAGINRRIFLESKALELLAVCSVEWGTQVIAQEEHKLHKPVRLSRHDIDKIGHARDQLIANMESPPSLLELAAQVGISDWKLKVGFREVFGTTVYGYLREHRMTYAHQLMDQGAVNINEVACMVGYSNPSHFTSAFRKKYGINPSEYVRGRVR